MDSATLIKFSQEPGLMTLEKIQEVKLWLEQFQSMLDIYRPALGDPRGLSVVAYMDKADWYINFKANNATEAQ
jgi:hypothetical protein